jgi:hypothetical protein
MKKLLCASGLMACLATLLIGCTTTSQQAQRAALVHQQNSDEAAKRGSYGEADKEQRRAQDAHHEAVVKALDEGKPLPPQPAAGDKPPAE